MPTNIIIAELKTSDGAVLGVFTLTAKEFSSGSVGFYANGKLEVDGKRHQGQFQLVEIGSKNKAKEE